MCYDYSTDILKKKQMWLQPPIIGMQPQTGSYHVFVKLV